MRATPTGRRAGPFVLPARRLLLVADATDNVARGDFGAAKPEDGAFAAAVAAILWLAGALWIARLRRTGAILVALGTFIVWYSFVTLHVVAGTSVSEIAGKSGTFWAVVALGTTTLATASFLAALTFLAFDVARRVQSRTAAAAPAVGQASR